MIKYTDLTRNSGSDLVGHTALPAQEPTNRKLIYKHKLNILSNNIRGLNKIAKRQQLTDYLSHNNIDIALLQETKVRHKGTEHIGNYFFEFSSQSPTISTSGSITEHAGVGIAIKNGSYL